MYERISEDIAQSYYQQNFPNDGQRFVAWYLRNVHLRDPIQAKDDITDGPDDKQIDAVFVDDDKSTVYVLHSKLRRTSLNLPTECSARRTGLKQKRALPASTSRFGITSVCFR